MAKGLIIDDDYGRLARAYYQRFGTEPVDATIGIAVDSPSHIPHTSLDTTLQAIIDAFGKGRDFQGPDLVIVSHGNERGMTMRLFPGHRTDSRSTVLRTLMDTSLSIAQIAKQIFTTEAQAAALIDKMNQVRGAGLSVVEFRGCTIGRVPENLAALKDFLGAKEVGGPDVLSTYGAVTPRMVSSTQFDHWQRNFASTAVFASMSSGRVGFRIVVVKGGSLIDMIAENNDAIAEWLRLFMSSSAPDGFENWMRHRLPVHYLQVIPPILPNDGNTSWPFSGSSPDYVRHIIRTS